MKTLIATLIFGIISGPTCHAVGITNIEKTIGEKKLKSGDCDISISFGSYSSGPDSQTKKKVMTFVEQSKDIDEAITWSSGKEGERSLCLQVIPSKLDNVYEDLKSFIPVESKRFWTEIKGTGKTPFRTQRPK